MQPLVFRSKVARAVAWVFVAFAALNLVDVLVRGRGQSGRIAFGALIAVAVVAFVLGLRPAVIADGRRVLLRNPVRDSSVPWGAVTAIDSTDVLRVHADTAVFRSWAIVAGNRSRRRALGRPTDAAQGGNVPGNAAARSAMAGRTHADFVVDQLTEVWRAHRNDAHGSPQVRWSWPALTGLLLAALLIIGTVFVG